jgi:hypothetical protein
MVDQQLLLFCSFYCPRSRGPLSFEIVIRIAETKNAYLQVCPKVLDRYIALVVLVYASETLYVCAYFVFAKVDRHIRFHLILQVEAHFAFEKLFGMFELFL